LQERGIEYIEIRSLDINPYEPVGISLNQILFLEVFATYCLLQPSPPIDLLEKAQIDKNLSAVALQGRQPGLKLNFNQKEVFFQDWAENIFDPLIKISQFFDQSQSSSSYQIAVKQQLEMLKDVNQLPSSIMLEAVQRQNNCFFDYAMDISLSHKKYFLKEPLPAQIQQNFDQFVKQSFIGQKEIEKNDTVDFEEFLKIYFNTV